MHARPLVVAASAVLALTLATPAVLHARTVVVPDDFPTVQGAIDAMEHDGQADTLLVKDGRYPESLVLHKGVAMWPYPGIGSRGQGDDGLPQVNAMTIVPQSDAAIGFDVRGFRLRGPVRVLTAGTSMSLTYAFSTCRMDSGLVLGKDNPWVVWACRVTGCTIFGGMDISSIGGAHARLNTVIGGGISVNGEGYLTIEGNYVHGPAAIGILGNDGGGGSSIVGNTVVGADVGIQFEADGGEIVSDNEVTDCSGTAFLWNSQNSARYTRNTAIRCGGFGFDLHGDEFTLGGNRALNCASGGFRVVEYGSYACVADSNVAGRCGGPGFDLGQATLRGNTSYLNAGAGYVVRTGGEVTNNIASANAGYGLVWQPAGAPSSIGCNDWFENTAGAVQGTSPGATDVSLAPYFCDLANDDVHLAADSPLLDLAGCGRVGALGQGCAAGAGVVADGPSGAVFTAGPNPSRTGVSFSWSPTLRPERLDVYDVRGARVWGESIAGGTRSLAWSGTGPDGRGLAPGVYYARLAGAGTSATRRFVLVR